MDRLKTAYFDCFSGAGGDMIVASLLDAGASEEALRRVISSIDMGGYTLSIERTVKKGLAATSFVVDLEDQAHQPHRNLDDILSILAKAELSSAQRERASQIFRKLAEAEAGVHGTTIDKIHFHEVGAVDAIIDVVSAVVCLDLLGVEEVICSPLTTGSGMVSCAHGLLPVPAPATMELLKGVPVRVGEDSGELLTPTAAAVLTTLATSFGIMPPMRVEYSGYGAGQKDTPQLPNVLRVVVGTTGESECSDYIAVLETTVDDTTPEVVGHCVERLLVEGALEAYTVPIHMKKSRPGVLISVLTTLNKVDELEQVLLAETTTFGIRRHYAQRTKLPRRNETVETPYGEVRVKVGELGGVHTVSPEYEDCKAVAQRHRVSLRRVMDAASRSWSEREGDHASG